MNRSLSSRMGQVSGPRDDRPGCAGILHGALPRADRADDGGRAAHLLLPRPFGDDGVPGLHPRAVASIGYLATGSRRWDGLAQAAAEVGLLFCTITLLTGPVWARSAWGVWWTWDARLSTTLILWLIYVAYLMLRGYMGNDVRMRRFSAVLGIIGALDVPIVYFSVGGGEPSIRRPSSWSGTACNTTWPVTLRVGMIAILLLFVALILKRMGLERFQEARDRLRGEVEAAGSGPLGSSARQGRCTMRKMLTVAAILSFLLAGPAPRWTPLSGPARAETDQPAVTAPSGGGARSHRRWSAR